MLLVIGYWLLVIGYWLLVIGKFLMPDARCPMPDARCPMPDAPCPMPSNNLLFLQNILQVISHCIRLFHHCQMTAIKLKDILAATVKHPVKASQMQHVFWFHNFVFSAGNKINRLLELGHYLRQRGESPLLWSSPTKPPKLPLDEPPRNLSSAAVPRSGESSLRQNPGQTRNLLRASEAASGDAFSLAACRRLETAQILPLDRCRRLH